ncbi:hypothetical protein CL619_00865 [archaeon]|nr:hypothetical protein [archaeon]|tara:strand:+ start:1422 stop:2900 length:1479 start_codon:yes stop_codon:yes gene_type:complete
MYKKRCLKFFVVLALIITVLSSFVLSTDLCFDDSDCASLGDTWACDTSILECVELYFGDAETSEDSIDETVDDTNATDEILDEEIIEDEIITEPETTSTTDTSELETSISDLDSRVTGVETNIDELTSQVEELTTTVNDVNTNVQLLSTDQHQLERDVEEQVNTIESEVSAGLAVLQEDIDSTKTELEGTQENIETSAAKASFFRTLSVVGVLIVIFGAIGYFLRMHKKEEEKVIPEEVKEYITKQIKLGVGETTIVAALKKSGWPEHDAKWAFEQTTVHNYNKFLTSQGKETKKVPKHKLSDKHYQKIAIVSIFSIALLAIMLLYVKQSVGFAVYYDGITNSDLSTLVEETIELSVEQNSFYSLIEYADLCVQVNDADASASFRVLKTPYGHTVEGLDENCDATSENYDFAVSFSTWNDFYTLSNTMTCSGLEAAHSVQQNSVAARGMYVLPSYYVESGFNKVDGRSYTDFCDALSLCLSSSDLALLDLGC